MRPEERFAGRYRLEERLGHGAMGEVWRGVDVLHSRAVAIKLLNPEVAASDPVWVAKFRQEAQIAVRLEHPGITKADDFGEYEGQWYLVMELLEGENLATELARHAQGLPVQRALSLAVQVADALGAAHLGGVVHRDLKPGNLMLLEGDRVKVCDFGIARFAEAATVNTLDGRLVGTPAYMAPEQCRGEAVDPRSDLYALGCVLFALLTGRPPFTADNHLAVMRQHLHEPPPRLRSLNSDVPADLEKYVLRLLAKNPADRPRDAADVAARLRAIAAVRASIPRPHWRPVVVQWPPEDQPPFERWTAEHERLIPMLTQQYAEIRPEVNATRHRLRARAWRPLHWLAEHTGDDRWRTIEANIKVLRKQDRPYNHGPVSPLYATPPPPPPYHTLTQNAVDAYRALCHQVINDLHILTDLYAHQDGQR